MSKEYKFNKAYLKSLLDRCYKALEDKSLSAQKREDLNADILFLKNALTNKYDCNNENFKDNNKKEFEQLKSEFVLYLKQLYHFLGDKGTTYLLDLYNAGIFGEYIDGNSPDVPDDIIVKTTLKTYENRVPFLFQKAKNIFSLSPTPHILLTRNPEIDSFCHCVDIADESFIVANTGECSSILAHEVEHGVEDRLHLAASMEELGPIFLEMCFEDELFKREGIKDYSSVLDRIEDNGDYLSFLSEFLKLTKALAAKNFSVSSLDFKKMFVDNVGILDNDVEGFLRDENPIEEINLYFDYLLSFLNAVSLYMKTRGKEIPEEMMMSYLKRKIPSILDDPFTFKMYDEYIEDIRRKL